MNASRMTMQKQWQNIGANAFRHGIPLERVLTGRGVIDALIRAGFERAARSAK